MKELIFNKVWRHLFLYCQILLRNHIQGILFYGDYSPLQGHADGVFGPHGKGVNPPAIV